MFSVIHIMPKFQIFGSKIKYIYTYRTYTIYETGQLSKTLLSLCNVVLSPEICDRLQYELIL